MPQKNIVNESGNFINELGILGHIENLKSQIVILNMITSYLGFAEKLRTIIFRCSAPPVSILIDFSTKIFATLWLIIQVRSTGNLCRILFGDGDKGAAHRNIRCRAFARIVPKSLHVGSDIMG